MLCSSHRHRTALLAVLLVVLAAALVVVQPVHGATVSSASGGAALDIPLLHGIAYDRRISATRGTNLGTRGALLRGTLVLYEDNRADSASRVSGQLEASARGRYKGRTLYIPCATHVLRTQLAQLLEFPVAGLVCELCADDAHNERLLAAFFAHEETEVPVYFVQDRDAAGELLALLQRVEHGNNNNNKKDKKKNSGAALADSVRISVGATEQAVAPMLNESLQAYTMVSQMHYRLREFRRATRQRPAPSVLLTANVDTMGVAPLARTTSGASGAIAAMELWRRLVSGAAMRTTNHTTNTNNNNNKNSDESTLQGPYGLTMLLGSTARVNYAGTASWLAAQKDVDMELYKIVISLDELLPILPLTHRPATRDEEKEEEEEAELAEFESRGRGGRTRNRAPVLSSSSALSSSSTNTPSSSGANENVLYMHVRDTFGRAPDEKRLEQLALSAAEATGLALQIVPARTNFHHYELRFEHEVFVNRQVPAATFSSYKTQKQDQIFRDVSRAVTAQDVAVLLQRIEFLHRFLQLLLNISEEPQPYDEERYNKDEKKNKERVTRWTGAATYLRGLLDHAARSPRSLLSLHNSANHSLEDYVTALEQHMRQHNSLARGTTLVTAASALRTEDVVPSAIRFYGPYEERMKVYVAKSSWSELGVMLLVVAALAGFAYAEFGLAGMKDLALSLGA